MDVVHQQEAEQVLQAEQALQVTETGSNRWPLDLGPASDVEPWDEIEERWSFREEEHDGWGPIKRRISSLPPADQLFPKLSH